MTPRHDEIIRQLDGGYAVAWDSTNVSEEAHEPFRQVLEEELDSLIDALGLDDADLSEEVGDALPG